MDSAFVCLVLDEKNPFELPIRALKASVELPSPGTSSTGIAEINELGVATSGFGFQRYGEADFEGTQIARNLLDETWWANTYVELFLSDGNSVRKLEQVLFTPSWSRLERAGT